MAVSLRTKLAWVLALLVGGCIRCAAQGPGVPIIKETKESEHEAEIGEAAKELFSGTNVVKLALVKQQLKRSFCHLDLPKVNTAKMSSREICDSARGSHLRVGWVYLCDRCDEWHLSLAGGYVLTTNGAVATCYHVVEPGREIREGCLVAADENGKLWGVSEVLAANRYSDACIVRVMGSHFKPLPLNTNVFPGDLVYCFSDPLEHRGYFSHGIVNRFYQIAGRRPLTAAPSAALSPTRINVSTDWAPGSSGSAVLDECGNAIGHVTTISAINEDEAPPEDKSRTPLPSMMVFHEAVSARDVLLLIQPPPAPP